MAKQHLWLSVEAFCELSGTNYHTALTALKRKHKQAYRKAPTANRESEIDYEYFRRRHKFKDRVTQEAHIFYYALNKYYDDNELIKLMTEFTKEPYSRWRDCINYSLFMNHSYTFVGCEIPNCIWKFWRFWRWFFIKALAKRGLKYDIKKIEEVL